MLYDVRPCRCVDGMCCAEWLYLVHPVGMRGCALITRSKGTQVASRLNPYISFAGDARQAMEFYQDVFGGTLRMNTFGEYGAQDSPDADKIMHGMLETGSGFTLMGADTPSGMEHNPGTNIAVSLSGDDA